MNILQESISEDNKKGQMIALFLRPDIGKHLQSKFDHLKGESIPVDDMHITLGLLHDADPKKILNLMGFLSSELTAPDVEIKSVDIFQPNEHNHKKHILFADPKSSDLYDMHEKIFDLFRKNGVKIDNGSFDFKPHITIKYCDEPPAIPAFEPLAFKMKTLGFADRGEKHLIELS